MVIDRAYQQRPFKDDEERLEILLKLYKKIRIRKGNENNDK